MARVLTAGAPRAAAIAAHTRDGEAGMSMWRMPMPASASTTAFITAAGAPSVPTSPQPFTPIGVSVDGVAWVSTA